MLGPDNAQIKKKFLRKKRTRQLKTSLTEVAKNDSIETEYKSESSANFKKSFKGRIIKECPTIEASEEDFKDPIAFIQRIWKTHQTGIAKIIPPLNWTQMTNRLFVENSLSKFRQSVTPLETRIQTLNQLFRGKV
jgi:hypothetical protein